MCYLRFFFRSLRTPRLSAVALNGSTPAASVRFSDIHAWSFNPDMIRKFISDQTNANEKGIHQKLSFFRQIPVMYISPSGRYLIFNFIPGQIFYRPDQSLRQRRHTGTDNIFPGLCVSCMTAYLNSVLSDTYCNQSHHSFTVPVVPRRWEMSGSPPLY